MGLDCPESGPGPSGPGSGPDPTGRSECPGQGMVGLDLCQGVQGQMLQGPDLGVRLCPDLDQTHFFYSFDLLRLDKKKYQKKY